MLGCLKEIKTALKRVPFMDDFYEWFIFKMRWIKIKAKIVFRGEYIHWGKNRDKKYLVIQCDNRNNGLFSIVFSVLPFIEFAEKKHYIPVVDLKTVYFPSVQDLDKKNIENAWEYYYEQPVRDSSLDEACQSKHVIKMTENSDRVVPYIHWDEIFPTDNGQLQYWHNIIIKYIRLNDDLEKKVEYYRKQLFPENSRIMGVCIRAEFYAGMLLGKKIHKGHPRVAPCEEYIEIVEERLKQWECDCVFLAIDDREYLEKFKNHFKSKCIYLERELLRWFENGSPVEDPQKKVHEFENITIYEKNEKYIIETYLLIKCTSLYSCKGGQGKYAYFVNGGRYENIEVYDKGVIA